ncbi:MAG: NAD kinase [Nonlabens sp.]
MRKVAIYGQYLHDDTIDVARELNDLLVHHSCEVLFEEQFCALLVEKQVIGKEHSFSILDETFDVLISIGGDGTILRAVAFVGRLNIPVLGVNAGRLGFLATVKRKALKSAVDHLISGRYNVVERTLLTADSNHEKNHPKPTNFALNEITVSRMNTTSMIQIETHLNGELLTSYWADGLIVSTPTGSTGYSLSCGGPVISPATNALVITPIAPHNLNARPLVIPDQTTITLKVSGRENQFLMSLDNRISSYPDQTIIELTKADFTIGFIQFPENSFIKTIRQKLLWGEDKRN